MTEDTLNTFDAIVIGIMALSCLFAFFRGLVKEVLSLAAWVGAGIIAIHYFPSALAKLQPHFKSDVVAAGVAGFGLYIAALIGLGIVNIVIFKSIKSGGEHGTLDNLLGLAFGAFRGAFIVSLGFFLISVALPEREYPKWLKESATRPYLESGAILLAKAAPESLMEVSSLQRKATAAVQNALLEKDRKRDETQEEEPVDIEEDEESGYSRNSNRDMERLLNSVEPAR